MQQIPELTASLLYITTLADGEDTADWRERADAELLAAEPDAPAARVRNLLPPSTRREEHIFALQCLQNSYFALRDLKLLFEGMMRVAMTSEERAYAEDVESQLDMAVQKMSEGINLLGPNLDQREQQVGDAGEQNTEEILDEETEQLLFRYLDRAKVELDDLGYLHTQKIESAGSLEEKADAENVLLEIRNALSKLEEAWYWLGGEEDMW